MSQPLVSVIMPVYNAVAFVAASIESVLNQTLQGFELIIVDDGSTDETPAILSDFVKRDGRIRIITQQNSRQAAARNLDIYEVKADLVVFLDSDDLARPQRLEFQTRFMSNHPEVDLLGGNERNQ